MGLIRTYVDAGVLIAAARSATAMAASAVAILDDPAREFVASEYLELEVLPKARYHQSKAETALYERFFTKAVVKLPFASEDGRDAFLLACQFGLSAFDALHLTAARKAGCAEFVTAERRTSPMFRYTELMVRTIA